MTDVALVICTLNRPVMLDRCLRAILGGIRLPTSIVVVDQGSGGIEPSLIAAFAERGVAVEHVRMSQRGVSRGRNLGAARAEAELVAFTDDDCVPDARWLAMLAEACRPGIDGVCGSVLPVPSSDPDLVPVSIRAGTVPMLYQGPHRHIPWEVGTGGNLLLRKHVLEQVGGFDEDLGPGTPARAAEDIDLLYRLLCVGCALAYTPDAVVLHEMKTRRDDLRTQYSYGLGMGLFLGRHAGRGDKGVATLLRPYGRNRGGEAQRAMRHGDPYAFAGALLNLIGAAGGLGLGYVQGRRRSQPRGRTGAFAGHTP